MLVVCAECGRHTKVAETCFFCGAAVVRPRASVARRASRAGAFAAVAAVGLACGARTELGAGNSGEDASIDVQSADVSVADAPLDAPLVFYGGPFPNQDAAADDADAGDADAGSIALYGAPPPGGDD